MKRRWLIVIRALLLVAMAMSAVLYVHYLNPADSEFCGRSSGCEELRRSPIGYLGGIGGPYLSLPLVGILAYAIVFGVSLLGPRLGQAKAEATQSGPEYVWLMRLAAAGGLGGVALLAYQIGTRTFCWMCMVVDVTAVLTAIAGVALWARTARAPADEPRPLVDPGLVTWAWSALGVLSVLLPLGWMAARPLPPVPQSVRALYVPDKINVVEFSDFECPYCRRLYPILEKAIEEYGDRVNFVRVHMPLGQHPMAERAARAAICGERLGTPEQARALVDKLYTVELAHGGIKNAWQELGYEEEPFRECLGSELTKQELERNHTIVEAAKFSGLPTTYIGGERIIGVRPLATFRDALAEAAKGESTGGIPGPVYLGICGLLVVALIGLGRTAGSTQRAS